MNTPKPKIKIIQPTASNDPSSLGSLNNSQSGLASKNKLSSKLSKGISKLVSKIKKRESYYCDL